MTANAAGPASGWEEFVADLDREILPIYAEHERRFDPDAVHGRIHICRSVIFSECMGRFYVNNRLGQIDFYAVRVATAFHDSGRKANGIDLWEDDSSRNCSEYVGRTSSRSGDADYAKYVAKLILKYGRKDLNKQIVQDADVLEIMRPSCGHGGIKGFRREFLGFAGSQDPVAPQIADANAIRETLIQEAWAWIQHTEGMKAHLRTSSAYMSDLLTELRKGCERYPMLSSVL